MIASCGKIVGSRGVELLAMNILTNLWLSFISIWDIKELAYLLSTICH